MIKRLFLVLICFAMIPCFAANIWTTHQGNPQHTGFIAGNFDANQFHLLWQKRIAEPTAKIYPQLVVLLSMKVYL